MFSYNFFDQILFSLQTTFLLYLPTNNIYVKTLLIPLIFSLIYTITQQIRKLNFKQLLNIDLYEYIYELFYKNSSKIEFEICMTRLNYNLRIESDVGYNSIRHYLFNNYEKMEGLRYFRKIPKTRNSIDEYNNEYDNLNENISKNDLNQILKELYLENNKILLPNGLKLKSKLKHISNESQKDDYQSIEKFYFKLQLICSKFKNPNENVNYLINEYKKILNAYNEYTKDYLEDKQFCYHYDSHHNDKPYFNKLYIGQEYKKFDSIFFEKKDEFLNNIRFFIENKDYYESKGKSYRNIILSYGKPGCGKTSIIHGLLNLLRREYNQKRQLIHLNLDKLSKKDLQNILFSEYLYVNDHDEGKLKIPFSSRIYFIEELDGYETILSRDLKNNEVILENEDINFEKINTNIKKDKTTIKDILNNPKNISKLTNYIARSEKENKLNIQDLLELLDGPISLKNGEIFVMTTNYIDKIDKALFRPGRVNNLLELKNSTLKDMKNILEYYYNTNLSYIDLSSFNDYDFSPALITEACNFYNYDVNKCIEYLKTKKY